MTLRSLIAILSIVLLILAGCEDGDSHGLSLDPNAGEGSVTGGVGAFPGGGGGDIEVALSLAGMWSGSAQVGGAAAFQQDGVTVPWAAQGLSTEHMPVTTQPPASGTLGVSLEMNTLVHGGLIGVYADGQTNAGQLRGSVTEGNIAVLEAGFPGGTTVITGIPNADGTQIEGTFEVLDAAASAVYAGTITLIRTGDVRDYGNLAFVLHDATSADFDMIINAPDGRQYHFYDEGYDDSIADTGLPDIMVFGGEVGPFAEVGTYHIAVEVFSDPSSVPKTVTLEAWEGGGFHSQLWQETVQGGLPHGTILAQRSHTYGGNNFTVSVVTKSAP